MLNIIILIVSIFVVIAIFMTAIHLNQIKEDLRRLIDIIEKDIQNHNS